MKLFILSLTTTVAVLAQVPQAPPPVPTPRAQPFPPAGPGAANNPAVVTPPGAAGRTFGQTVVGEKGVVPSAVAPGPTNTFRVTLPPRFGPGGTFPPGTGGSFPPATGGSFTPASVGTFSPGTAGTFQPATGPGFVATNFPPGNPNRFGFVSTNFPPERALDINAPLLGTTITNAFGSGVGAPVPLGPTATPTQTPVGAPAGAEQGTGQEIVFDFPPGTTVRRVVPGTPPTTRSTPAPRNPAGPTIPR